MQELQHKLVKMKQFKALKNLGNPFDADIDAEYPRSMTPTGIFIVFPEQVDALNNISKSFD